VIGVALGDVVGVFWVTICRESPSNRGLNRFSECSFGSDLVRFQVAAAVDF
jgi:hypothetical protein